MARTLVLTVVGKDRPGLVEVLADLITQYEGSWDESRMACLSGHFAGVVQVHLPESRADSLICALPALLDSGLSVSVVSSDSALADVDCRKSWWLDLVSQDRPGIVRDISSRLASLGVSVQDLRTIIEDAPMSGERLFRAEAELVPPAGADFEQIRAALEQLADDMMIDLKLNNEKE